MALWQLHEFIANLFHHRGDDKFFDSCTAEPQTRGALPSSQAEASASTQLGVGFLGELPIYWLQQYKGVNLDRDSSTLPVIFLGIVNSCDRTVTKKANYISTTVE